jgi:hypothetical protein
MWSQCGCSAKIGPELRYACMRGIIAAAVQIAFD